MLCLSLEESQNWMLRAKINEIVLEEKITYFLTKVLEINETFIGESFPRYLWNKISLHGLLESLKFCPHWIVFL